MHQAEATDVTSLGEGYKKPSPPSAVPATLTWLTGLVEHTTREQGKVRQFNQGHPWIYHTRVSPGYMPGHVAKAGTFTIHPISFSLEENERSEGDGMERRN